jgi:hypothetical protein
MDRHQEADGINEALAGTLRVALTVAGQLAERIARAREQAARAARAASEQHARELRARVDAERAAARAALAPVAREEWWQRAEPDEIARAWEAAQAWREHDPAARAAAERIHAEVRSRYGIDTRDLRADPAAVRAALAAHDSARERAGGQRSRARDEQAEASALLAGANRADAAQDADRDGDRRTGDRVDADHVAEAAGREDLAAALEGVADAEAVEARVVAATNQAHPAAEAVTATSPPRAPRARRARGAGRVKDRSRSR